MNKKELEENRDDWEKEAKRNSDAEQYYRSQLSKAHEILGRVIHQLSERWDTVRLTKYFPTDNLGNTRGINNPSGKLNHLKNEED